MLQVLLDIDATRCGVIFGTFYQEKLSEVSNQIETDHQRYLFLKGVM